MSEEERWMELDERLKRLDFLDRKEKTYKFYLTNPAEMAFDFTR